MEYLRPDVYITEVPGVGAIQAVSTSVGAFLGVSKRGKVGEAVYVTSWTDYINKFARGLASPFMSDSYLAYAVYGFFQNGGSKLYVTRVVSATGSAKATVTVPASTGVPFTALDEVDWANTKLAVKVEANGLNFDVTISYDGEEVEKFVAVSGTSTDDNYYVTMINGVSNYVTVGTTGTLAVGTGTMGSGNDGTTPTDSDYTGARGLQSLDIIDDVNLIAIPGITTETVLNGILTYCDTRNDCFAILDVPVNNTPANAKTAREALSGTNGAIYYPWIKVSDPLSTSGVLRTCPPSGHVAGIYARTDTNRGVHKAPAGIECNIRGAIDVERRLSNGEVELLNPAGVNCILSKKGAGIVVWGARTVSALATKRYVSDVRFDIKVRVSCQRGTQWAVFEPNDSDLWSKMTSALSAFLTVEWMDGALLGETAEEAFFVKCDEELNTEEIRDAGRVIAEIGYAKRKPGEFVIICIRQMASSSN